MIALVKDIEERRKEIEAHPQCDSVEEDALAPVGLDPFQKSRSPNATFGEPPRC